MSLLSDLKSKLEQSKQVFAKVARSAYQNPTLRKISDLGEETSNVVFSPYKSIAKDVKDVVQGTARSFVGAGLSLADKEQFTPKSFVSKALLGPKPVPRFEKQTLDLASDVEKFGVPRNIAVPAAFAVGALDIASPLPFSLEDFTKAGIKNLGKKELDDLVKRFGKEEVEKLIKGGAKEEVLKAAEIIVKDRVSSPKPRSAVYDINTDRLAVNTVGKEQVGFAKDTIKSELETIYGRPISQEEVVQFAKQKKVLKDIASRQSVLEEAAAIRRTEENLVSLANELGKLQQGAKDSPAAVAKFQELIDSYKVVKSLSRRDAVLLGSRRGVVSELPENLKVVDEIISKIDNVDGQIDEILTEAGKIDPYNITQLNNFYRKYVKPSRIEVLNEMRYINLLSNPKTHVVNAASNLLQVVVRPLDRLASGIVDKVYSGITGKSRQQYVREVPEYVKGMANSIGDAFKEAYRTFKGGVVERPDMVRRPTGKLPKVFTSVTRALEASDVFFRKLLAAGEYEALVFRELKKSGGKELTQDTLNLLRKKADDTALEYVFRKELGSADQGYLNRKVIDGVAESLKDLGQKVPAFRFIVPFVDTPTNILKQGIERTPVIGLATLPGASNKLDIIGRQLVGSTLFMGAGYLAMQDRITWKAPANKKDAADFYATGKQEYSVKIGDNWVQFNRLGPLAYPIAFAAAIKAQYDENKDLEEKGKDPRRLDENVVRALLKMTRFFGDQSYMENVGNLMDALVDGDYYKFNRLTANIPAQFIPMQGFVSFITRMIDDVYRKPESILDNLKSQLPFLSQSVGYWEDPFGEASRRQNNLLNLLSPVSITKEKELFPVGKKIKRPGPSYLQTVPKSTVE